MRQSIQDKAAALMARRDMDNFSEFLSQLIREEDERVVMREEAASPRITPGAPERSVNYKVRPNSKGVTDAAAVSKVVKKIRKSAAPGPVDEHSV